MGEKEQAGAIDPATGRTMNWTPIADEGARSNVGAGQVTEILERTAAPDAGGAAADERSTSVKSAKSNSSEREGYVELQPGDEDPVARSTSVKSGKSNSSEREAEPGTGADEEAGERSTSVKSGKSNTSDREIQAETDSAGDPAARATTVKSSKSHSSD